MRKDFFVGALFLCLATFCPPAANGELKGSGTELDPYLICSDSDWYEMCKISSVGTYFMLTADIKVTSPYGAGYDTWPFYGTFDGNGHTIILDINLKRNYEITGGLFSVLNNAVVKNLNVTGYVRSYSNENDRFFGGICGKSIGSEFINCVNKVSFDFTECTYTGNRYVGGICGHASGSSIFRGCENKTAITNQTNHRLCYTGGIVAYSSGSKIERCTNTELISAKSCMSQYQPDHVYCGGIVGYSNGDQISSCFNTGGVEAIMKTDLSRSLYVGGYAGGLAGYAKMTTISNSYNARNVRATYSGSYTNRYTPYAGGIFGKASDTSTVVTNCFVTNSVISVTTDGRCGVIGYDGQVNNCYVTPTAGTSKGQGASEDKNYSQCSEVAVASTGWLIQELKWNFDDTWYFDGNNQVPQLKKDPIVILNATDLTYGMTTFDFITSSNTLSPLNITSDDNGLILEDGDCTPVKTGLITIQVNQNASGEWRSFQKNYQLTIKPKDLIVRAPVLSTVYGRTLPEIRLTYSGFTLNDSESTLKNKPEILCDAFDGCDAGTYTITPSGGQAKNYNLRYETGELTIHQAPLSIRVQDSYRSINEANPEFVLVFDGFRYNDNQNSLERLPQISCEASYDSPAGTYQIILTGGYDKNYLYELYNGNLYISEESGIETIKVDYNSDVRYFTTTGIEIKPGKNEALPTGIYIRVQNGVATKIKI